MPSLSMLLNGLIDPSTKPLWERWQPTLDANGQPILSQEQRDFFIKSLNSNPTGGPLPFSLLSNPSNLNNADLWNAYVQTNEHALNPPDDMWGRLAGIVGPGIATAGAGTLLGGATTATPSTIAGSTASPSLVGSAGADTLGTGITASPSGANGVTGLTAGSTGASGIGPGAAGTSLAPGSFAGETAYPVIGGSSGTAVAGGTGGGSVGAASAGGGTALGRLVSGNGTPTDYASILGNLGIAGLGYYGASRQADSLAGIAAENRSDRMPFYAKSLEYLNNPGAYAEGPGQAALQANLRALSVNGNPADNPALLGIATSSALRDWRDAVTGFGNIGLSGSDTRASLMSGAAGADANALNALGYGLGSTLNPPSTIEQLLKQLKGAGVGLA